MQYHLFSNEVALSVQHSITLLAFIGALYGAYLILKQH